MSVIYEHTSRDSCEEFSVALDDGRTLNIGITPEGIIMDVYSLDEDDGVRDHYHLGTMAMMFDEWADEIISFDSRTKVVSSNHNG